MNVSVRTLCLLVSSPILSAPLLAAEAESSYIPASHTLERYASLWEKSPFSPESVVPAAANNTEWLLTGIMVIGDAPIVTLTNQTTTKTVSLSPGQTVEGLNLVHAEWSNNAQESFAVVSINGSQKRITFDQQSLATLSARTASNLPPAANNTPRVVIPTPTTQGATVITPAATNSKQVTPRRRIIRRSP